MRGFICTERNLAWAKLQNDLAWVYVDPTDRSHPKEIAKASAVFALLAQELDPSRTPQELKEAADNEALEFAEKLVADGYATWKRDFDLQKIHQQLSDWKAKKNAVRRLTA